MSPRFSRLDASDFRHLRQCVHFPPKTRGDVACESFPILVSEIIMDIELVVAWMCAVAAPQPTPQIERTALNIAEPALSRKAAFLSNGACGSVAAAYNLPITAQILADHN